MESLMECTGLALGHAGQARILWAAAAIDAEPKQVEVCSPAHRPSRI